jgi:hypothetical protein
MTNTAEQLSPAELKAELEAIWNKPGIIGDRLSWHFTKNGAGGIYHQRHKMPEYLTPEQKARRKGLAMYNKALKASVMAEAKQTAQDNGLVFYDFRPAPKKATEAEPVVKATKAKAKPIASTNDKLIKAMNIFWRVPQSDLTAFLVRFGIAADIAAQIASMPTLDAVAREFLKTAITA